MLREGCRVVFRAPESWVLDQELRGRAATELPWALELRGLLEPRSHCTSAGRVLNMTLQFHRAPKPLKKAPNSRRPALLAPANRTPKDQLLPRNFAVAMCGFRPLRLLEANVSRILPVSGRSKPVFVDNILKRMTILFGQSLWTKNSGAASGY